SKFVAGAGWRQRILPSRRSRQSVSSFALSKAVRNILSPQMTGEEFPEGRAVFQTTFEAGPKCAGGGVPSPIPSPPGPRNCGHCAANTEHALTQKRKVTRFI